MFSGKPGASLSALKVQIWTCSSDISKLGTGGVLQFQVLARAQTNTCSNPSLHPTIQYFNMLAGGDPPVSWLGMIPDITDFSLDESFSGPVNFGSCKKYYSVCIRGPKKHIGARLQKKTTHNQVRPTFSILINTELCLNTTSYTV